MIDAATARRERAWTEHIAPGAPGTTPEDLDVEDALVGALIAREVEWRDCGLVVGQLRRPQNQRLVNTWLELGPCEVGALATGLAERFPSPADHYWHEAISAKLKASQAGLSPTAGEKTDEVIMGWARSIASAEAERRRQDRVTRAQLEEEDSGSEVDPASGFPRELLPKRLDEVLQAHAEGVDASFELVAIPALAVLSAALGPNWVTGPVSFERPAQLWFCLVAPSGSAKSPAARPILEPLYEADKAVRERHRNEQLEAEAKAIDQGKSPDRVSIPPRRRIFLNTFTVEALTVELQRAEGHGLLVNADEVAALIDGLDGYRARGRAGRANMLSLWNGSPIRDSRKVAESVEVDHPFCAVLGGVQASTLRKLDLKDADGLAARFNWSHVKVQPGGLGRGIPDEARGYWKTLVDTALAYQGSADLQRWCDRGRRLLDARLREWKTRAIQLDNAGMGLRASFYGKAGDQAVRLVSLLHGLERLVPGQVLRGGLVAEDTVDHGLRLADYFLEHGIKTVEVVTRPQDDVERLVTNPADRDVLAALVSTVRAGESVERSATEWVGRLGLEISASALGKSLGRLEELTETGMLTEPQVRRSRSASKRGWIVSRQP